MFGAARGEDVRIADVLAVHVPDVGHHLGHVGELRRMGFVHDEIAGQRGVVLQPVHGVETLALLVEFVTLDDELDIGFGGEIEAFEGRFDVAHARIVERDAHLLGLLEALDAGERRTHAVPGHYGNFIRSGDLRGILLRFAAVVVLAAGEGCERSGDQDGHKEMFHG